MLNCPQPGAVVDPDRIIIDAHHHMWSRPDGNYLLDEFLADTGTGHRIAASVYVQGRSMYRSDCPDEMKPVGETEFAAEIAERCEAAPAGTTRACAAIIAYADLTLGARVAPVLDAHIAAGKGRLRGVRHITAWDPDPSLQVAGYDVKPELLASHAFREGVACVVGRGLHFEAFLFHPQIGELVDLARRFPRGRFVLNHAGTPLGIGAYADRPSEAFVAWRDGIIALAQCPNVTIKLGGFGMHWLGFPFDAARQSPAQDLSEAWRSIIDVCVDAFGVRRCMFESNFPVDCRSTSYRELWSAYKLAVRQASDEERDWLFQRTAAETYSIDPAVLAGFFA